MPLPRPSTRILERVRADEGWVLVPALVLMAVTLALAFALLAVVDRQTGSAREKRTADAAQTLADGIVTSTASALASMETTDAASLAVSWPVSGTCTVVTGDLQAATPTTPPSSETAAQALGRRVRAAVKRGFDETDNEYARTAGASTKWSVHLCPDRGGDVWSEEYLDASLATPVSAARRTVWVRAQADVRGVAGKVAGGSRAAAQKVRQANAPFVAPEDLAIGTASFSTHLSSDVTNVLKDSPVGALVLRGLLGQGRLVENGQAKIGLRCGLLDALDNPGLNLCLGGALGGTNSVVGAGTNTLGLPGIGTALGGILGIDRTVNLSSYTVAPDRARAAFEALARQNGNYVEAAMGSKAGTSQADTSCFASAAVGGKTLTAANTADQVVYLRQVGDGGVGSDDPFCTLPAGSSPAVLVVERGGVRVTGGFTGVLYAANRQEVDGATTPEQVQAKRASARYRETVRIEYPGKVTGAVWTDGAGGQVGLYPPASAPTSNALLQVGGPQGLCSLPLLGPVVNGLGTVLRGVLDTVGNLAGGLVGGVQYRSVPGAAAGCDLLKTSLGSLTNSQLLSLFGSGQTGRQVVVREKRECDGLAVVLGPLIAECSRTVTRPGTWSAWEPAQTTSFDVPSLLTNLAAPDVLNQLFGTLSSALVDWTAVDRNVDRIRLANVGMAVGAEPVPGTYRVVPARGSLVVGGA